MGPKKTAADRQLERETRQKEREEAKDKKEREKVAQMTLEERNKYNERFERRLHHQQLLERSLRNVGGNGRSISFFLARCPLDLFGQVFKFLRAPDQGNLRSCCKHLVNAFNLAVLNEHYIPLAVSLSNPVPHRQGIIFKDPMKQAPEPSKDSSSEDDTPESLDQKPCEAEIPCQVTIDWSLCRWAPATVTAPRLVPKSRHKGHQVRGPPTPRSLWANITLLFEATQERKNRTVENLQTPVPKCDFQKDLKKGILRLDRWTKRLRYARFSGCDELQSLKGCDLLYVPKTRASKKGNSLQYIDFINFSALTALGDSVYCSCTPVLLDFRGLEKVESVGRDFLYNCTTLKFVDFSALTSLKYVEHGWLYSATALQTVSFKGCNKIESIGNDWLRNCTFLQHIDFSALTHLKKIGNHCLGMCKELKHLDLKGFRSLGFLGDYFGNDCASLQSVDMSCLAGLRSLGRNFLFNCRSLQFLDISGLTSLEVIGDLFLALAGGLTSVTFFSATDPLKCLQSLRSIGSKFLVSANHLTQLCFSGLPQLECIGRECFSDCVNLHSVELSQAPKLEKIGDRFCYGCLHLKTVTFLCLPSIASIGPDMLFAKCPELQLILCDSEEIRSLLPKELPSAIQRINTPD